MKWGAPETCINVDVVAIEKMARVANWVIVVRNSVVGNRDSLINLEQEDD